MIVYRLHFIRHALTQGNVEHRFVGVTDIPALPKGLDTIREYKAEGMYPNVSQVYVSPLLRCRQTAEVIYEDTPMEIVDGLHEMNFGDLEDKTLEEAKKLPSFAEYERIIKSKDPAARIPGGESMNDLLKRVSTSINDIIADMFKRQITSAAVVTHGGLISSTMATWGLPKQDLMHWMVDNGCGFTVLLQSDIWSTNQVFEVYDKIAPAQKPMSEDAYLDYAESLLTEDDLKDPNPPKEKK